MKDTNYLYAKGSGNLQIPYAEYEALMEEVREAQRLQKVKSAVLGDLQRFLDGGSMIDSGDVSNPPVRSKEEPEPAPPKEPVPEKVSSESAAEHLEPNLVQTSVVERASMSQLPPFKKEISEHFNKFDESGRLFNVFTQYYTCLNDVCGGTVRVTIKDGFCSLWNYDEWEEFAFVDIFEDRLRITIDPRYTDALKLLSLCEAPRLISSRRNVICVQVSDLNQVVLDVLSKAFSEAGLQTK